MVGHSSVNCWFNCAHPLRLITTNRRVQMACQHEIPLGNDLSALVSSLRPMKRLCPILSLCLLTFFGKAPVTAAEDAFIEIRSESGDVDYELSTGIATVTNRFVAQYQDVTLSANYGQLNRTSGEMILQGAVHLQREDQIWRGEELRYNFLTRQMSAGEFRTGRPPFFAAAKGLTADLTNNFYTATDAYLTTDDVAQPGLRVRAKSIRIVPGKYLEARHAILYAGKLPVFYLPYVRYNLDGDSNHWTLTPGYRSIYGLFMLGGYHWRANDQVDGVFHLDYRVKRGFGVGPDVNYDAGRFGEGELKFYYLYDTDPGETSTTSTNASIPHNRDRLYLTHGVTVRTNLEARLVLRHQSDAYVTRDFLESEYRANPQPSSFIEANQRWPNFTLGFTAQAQVNDFQDTVERLPDVKLYALRQQLGESPLFYEGESSLGYYRQNFADDSPTNDYSAFRADSYHEVLLPLNMFGWLNLAPRVGGRFTHYGETDGEGSSLTAQDRWVFNTGAELSFKASRVWSEPQSKLLELDGIRHIIQPTFNYVYVPEPSVRPPELPQFDTDLPSLRLLPNDFPDYNNIDSIDARNVIRLGLRNKLQTKRNGQVDNLLNWSLFTDWRLDRLPGQATFSDLFSDLDFKPRSWLTLTSELRYGVDTGQIRISQHYLTISPNNRWSWMLGHRYVREDPELGFIPGNNLFTSSIYYRLDDNWGLRMSHHFETEDGTLEEQYYTLYRDLRSWTAALTFRVRDNRDEGLDYGAAFTFSLKAFPRYSLGDDANKPSLLLGN